MPIFPNTPTLVDAATPDSAQSRIGYDGEKYELVFSDEFEVDGRTFYAGEFACLKDCRTAPGD